VAAPEDEADASLTLPIPRDGLCDIRLSFPGSPANAAQARWEVVHADGVAVEWVDLRNFGEGPGTGRDRFRRERPARLILHSGRAGGPAGIKALGFARVGGLIVLWSEPLPPRPG